MNQTRYPIVYVGDGVSLERRLGIRLSLRESIDESNADGSPHRGSGERSADPGIDLKLIAEGSTRVSMKFRSRSRKKLTNYERGV